MSETTLCDICKKPIKAHTSVLFKHSIYSQYIVKIKRIEEGFSLAGFFRKSETLDVCPECMKKFAEHVRKEGNSNENT